MAWGWALGPFSRAGCGDIGGKSYACAVGLQNTQSPEPHGYQCQSRHWLRCVPKGAIAGSQLWSRVHVHIHTHIGVRNTGMCLSMHTPCEHLHRSSTWLSYALMGMCPPEGSGGFGLVCGASARVCLISFPHCLRLVFRPQPSGSPFTQHRLHSLC